MNIDKEISGQKSIFSPPQRFDAEICTAQNLREAALGARAGTALWLGLRMMAVLLAGLRGMLGLTRQERQVYREHAYRVRGAIAAVQREHETKINNGDVIAGWSRSSRPWDVMMKTKWNFPKDRLYSRTARRLGYYERAFPVTAERPASGAESGGIIRLIARGISVLTGLLKSGSSPLGLSAAHFGPD